MDSVLNRPLFRRRNARDRLNDLAGVKKFQDGGAVPRAPQTSSPVAGQASGLAAIPQVIYRDKTGYLDLVKKAQRGGQITWEDYTALLENEDVTTQQAQDILSMVENPGLVIGEDEARISMRPELHRMPAVPNDPRQGATLRGIVDYAGDVFGGTTTGEAAAREAGTAADQAAFDQYTAEGGFEEALRRMRESDADLFGRLEAAAGMRNLPPSGAGVPAEAVPPGARQNPSEPPSGPVFEREGRNFPKPAPMGPSGMEEERRGSRPPVATETMPLPAGPVFERKGRGPGPLVTSPAEVAAGLNDPSPEVREKTVADFMKEFTDAAPEYKGGDKRLMHAMIGFAIAAGDSPNAMTNIARGLQAGTEMFLKDKAAKDEFDRQIQLSAMQYGLEGVAKERELGKPALQFTATKDMKWKGRDIKAGTSLYLSYKDISDGGGVVPNGLVDAATYKGLAEREAGIVEAAQKMYDRYVIDDSELRLTTEQYGVHAANVAKSQRALDYFERALFKIGEDGNLTGVPGSFKKLVGKLGSAAGFTTSDLDALAGAGNAAEMEELLLRGVMDTVPSVVEGQSANSISDTDVRLAIRRLVSLAVEQGTFSSLFTNEDTVIRQIQDSMNVIAGNRQREFANMAAIEARLANRFTKGGDWNSPAYASDVLQPLRQSAGLGGEADFASPLGDMVMGENGTYKLIFPGG